MMAWATSYGRPGAGPETVRTLAAMSANRSSGYLAAVERALEPFSSRRRVSPAQLLRQWAGFVADARRGYAWGWDDFDNERGVRDAIQALLDDAAVRSFPEAAEWRERVDAIDQQYREILVALSEAETRPWWLAGVPRFAGQELASDLRRMFELEVEVRSPD